MITFLITTGVIILALGLVSYVSSKRTTHTSDEASALSLLPGDIKYESPSGLLPHHDVDSYQHHPQSGSLFLS